MTKNRRILSIILIFVIAIITIRQPTKATLYEGNVIEKVKDGDVFYPGTTTSELHTQLKLRCFLLR